MRKLQVSLIAMLCFMLMVSPVIAAGTPGEPGGATVQLTGNVEPAMIDISVDKSLLEMDIIAGETTATDDVIISSTSFIPIKVSVDSIEHKLDSWAPDMIVEDPANLTLGDAQNKAKLTFDTISDSFRTVGYEKIAPIGNCATFKGFDGMDWTDVLNPVYIGTLKESADGITKVSETLSTTLEVSKKRVLSKAFKADMVLNFEAEEEI